MYEVDNHKNALGRVSVVNQAGQVLYDNYVLPQAHQKITDLRTYFSGITVEDLETKAIEFEEA